MKNPFLVLLLATTVLSTLTIKADSSRPDNHAPIHVMGDHMHKKGEWMLGYRFKKMSMRDLYIGNNRTNSTSVLNQYMMAPQKMDMTAHILGIMYAPSDTITLSMMMPFMEKEMQAINRMDMPVKSRSSSTGDIKLNSLLLLEESDSSHTHAHLAVSVPTGSIDEDNQGMRLPYGMQIGSGTWDLTTGITHKQFFNNSSFGLQGLATVRTGKNKHDYRFGNQYKLNTWYAYNLNHHWATSIGVDYIINEDIKGADPMLNPMMSAAAVADLAGTKRSSFYLGVNYLDTTGHRFAVTLGNEFYRDLDGPQLAKDLELTFGWQYAF